MKALEERSPYAVGLVALAALAALAVVVVLLSVLSFGTTTYSAVLSQTAGLREGESVQVAGVVVGEVRAIELRDTDVEVRFTVADDIRLGELTTAEVKVATLLGTHYLQVTPRGSGSLADDTIALERTSVPFNLEDVLEQGTDTLGELDAPGLARALEAVTGTLRRAGDDVAPALERVGRLAYPAAERSEQTGDLLGSVERVSTMLQEDSEDVLALMQQTTLVLDEVTSRREAIRRLLERTTALSRSLAGLVEDTRDDLRPALRDLDTALTALREEDETLQSLLSTLAPAVRYVANAAGNGPWVDLYARPPVLPSDDQRCALGDCG